MRLFFLFVAVPIIEIALFIQVGGVIGLWPTLAIVVLTALAGTMLMRTQGVQALQRLQATLAEGGDPSGALVHGALILVAGVLLLTPGFFTDALGITLLIPPARAAIIRQLGKRIVAQGVVFTSGGGPAARPPGGAGDEPIEAEYEVLDEEESRPSDGPDRPRGNSGWTRGE